MAGLGGQPLTIPFAEAYTALERGTLVVMFSDGLGTHWSFDRYPGLLARHPAVIASVLYRDHWRRRDDVTVVAVGPKGE